MDLTLRPIIVPDDYPHMANLINAAAPAPISAEQLAERDRTLPAEIIRHRLAAVGADGSMVGYGTALRIPSDQPGRFKITVIIDPARRQQGAGTMLADALERFALELGGTWFDGQVRENESEALTFAEKRGYKITEHLFDSVLDLATFDEGRFAGAVAKVQEGGLRFFAFADVILIAADGDRWAGFTLIAPNPVNNAMYNGGTGVAREYRGRGLALALKLLSIRKARELGAPYMRTDNHDKNAPMLAINRKLGYLPEPGTYGLQKRL